MLISNDRISSFPYRCQESTTESTCNTNARCVPHLGLTFGQDQRTSTRSDIMPFGCKTQIKFASCVLHQIPSIVCPVYTLHMLGNNTAEDEWHIYLTSFTKMLTRSSKHRRLTQRACGHAPQPHTVFTDDRCLDHLRLPLSGAFTSALHAPRLLSEYRHGTLQKLHMM